MTPCYFLKQACLHNRNLCIIDLMDFSKGLWQGGLSSQAIQVF
jgi:hypothetical protein